jgi:hypothetical protein
METKICNTCKIELSLDSFSKNKTRKDGYNCSCRECSSKKFKEWSIKNTEKLKETKFLYRENNKEHIQNLRKNVRLNGGAEKDKEYYQKNKVIINQKQNERYKQRKLIDPLFKLKCRIISNISTYIKRNGYTKTSRTQEILGCDYQEFKEHLESLWESWMSWDNYGNPKDGIYEPNKTWDIDHKVPTSISTTEEELLKLNHFSNLQPLCSYVNRFVKSDNLGFTN